MAPTANSMHANGTSNGVPKPKIHLYTNHRCPYAHRSHIALQELGLEFEETIIDLDSPRPQWYLDINPEVSSSNHPSNAVYELTTNPRSCTEHEVHRPRGIEGRDHHRVSDRQSILM